MRSKVWATSAFLLIPWLPLACSAGGDNPTGGRDDIQRGGNGGNGNAAGVFGNGGNLGSAGYGGVDGNGGVAGNGVFGNSGSSGSSGSSGTDGASGSSGSAGSMGSMGSGGLGGDGGMGNVGGIAGDAGTAGDGGTTGTAGMGGTVGIGGTTGIGGGGTGGTGRQPIIPPVTAECPAFRNATITFMGLGGIRIVAGAKAAGPTAPMVFYWHGTGSTSGEFATMAGAVQQGVVSEGGVLVSFQGTTGGDLLSGTSIFGAGDFNLADQLVACAVRDHNIDPKRIFATGCSAGGLFSAAMAARRSNYMAAAAPNSGGWVVPVQWQNDNTPALMTIHGAAGRDVVVVDFSVTSKTADDAFKARGGFVINCDHGGGHCGGGGLAGSIWTFFKAHHYGVTPNPWTSLPAGFHSSCEIY